MNKLLIPNSSTTQLSLSQSMIVLSKSKMTTNPAIDSVPVCVSKEYIKERDRDGVYVIDKEDAWAELNIYRVCGSKLITA